MHWFRWFMFSSICQGIFFCQKVTYGCGNGEAGFDGARAMPDPGKPDPRPAGRDFFLSHRGSGGSALSELLKGGGTAGGTAGKSEKTRADSLFGCEGWLTHVCLFGHGHVEIYSSWNGHELW